MLEFHTSPTVLSLAQLLGYEQLPYQWSPPRTVRPFPKGLRGLLRRMAWTPRGDESIRSDLRRAAGRHRRSTHAGRCDFEVAVLVERVRVFFRRRRNMRVGEICIRDVVCADRDTPVQEAARLMRSHHVGNVLVVENGARGRTPVGIVTDRDIAVGVVAVGVAASGLTVGELMGGDLITIPEDQGIFETAEQMQRHGIRRLPVVDRQGLLVGMITVDDLLDFLTMHLSELSRAIARERRKEIEARP